MESSNVAEPIFLFIDILENIINKGINVLILQRPFGEVTKANKILFAVIKSNHLL